MADNLDLEDREQQKYKTYLIQDNVEHGSW